MGKNVDLRPDIAAAKSRMRVKLGGGKEIKNLPGHLWDGETVERMTTGTYGSATGLIVLTDRRLISLKEGMMGKKSEDFPMDKVSSVQWSSGILTGSLTIFASGNKAEIKNVNKDDGKELTDLVRARISVPKDPSQRPRRQRQRRTWRTSCGSWPRCGTRGS